MTDTQNTISDAMVEAGAKHMAKERSHELSDLSAAMDEQSNWRRYMDEVRSLLRAALAHQAPREVVGWQPIETAPKDGTAFWVWWPHWYHFPLTAYWDTFQLHLADSNQPAKPWELGQPHGPALWTPMQMPSTLPAQDICAKNAQKSDGTAQGDLAGKLEANFFDGTLADALEVIASEPDCPVTSACVQEAANKIRWASDRLTALRADQSRDGVIEKHMKRLKSLLGEGEFYANGDRFDLMFEPKGALTGAQHRTVGKMACGDTAYCLPPLVAALLNEALKDSAQ